MGALLAVAMQPYGGYHYPPPSNGYPYPYAAVQQPLPTPSSSSTSLETPVHAGPAAAPTKKRTRSSAASEISAQQPKASKGKAARAALGSAAGTTAGDRPRENNDEATSRHTVALPGDGDSDDQLDGDESDGPGTGAGGKRKKRLPLSCGECRRRRIKCDRYAPATSPSLGAGRIVY